MENPVRIVMVEDSPLDAELLLKRLSASGLVLQTQIVQDRGGMIAALESNTPDLILSDYSLPGFSGPSALEIAQSVCPDVPFVFVSGAIGEEVAIESLKRGATDYVLKDRPERLPLAVRRALEEARQRLERRQAQEELSRRARELTVLNADLQQFAYAASHDLQEPLRTISLFSKLLVTKYTAVLDEQAQDYLRYVESAAQHMSALLEDMLLYAKVPAQDRTVQEVDLNKVLDDALFLFKATIEENRAEITRDPLPTVQANTAQFGLVLQNLIGNALRYRGSDPPHIHVSAAQWRGAWLISVRDNGIGFEPEYAEQIFGLFKRLHSRESNGTGLGLAICKRIVEVYGGRIWAESRPNVGSTFYFSVPAIEDQPGAAAPPAEISA